MQLAAHLLLRFRVLKKKSKNEISKELGVELGFKDSMTIDPEKNMKTINNSFLEVARQDHAVIMKMMKI